MITKKVILIVGKVPTDGLGDTMLTAEKEYSITFTEKQKILCLSLPRSGFNLLYILVKGVEIYKA